MNYFFKTFFSHVFLMGNLFCPNCLTFCYSFRIFSNFKIFFLFALNVAAYWNHLFKSLNHYLNHYFPYWWNLLFFCFLSNQENLHMIYHVYNLLFVYQKINIVVLSRHKVIISFMLSLLECNTCPSCLSLEDIKLIAIVKWIFRVWYFLLRSYMICFKYGLILFNWFNWFHSIDSVLFLSPIFHILWNCRNRIYLPFLVYSNLLLPFLVQILSITDYFVFYYLN